MSQYNVGLGGQGEYFPLETYPPKHMKYWSFT